MLTNTTTVDRRTFEARTGWRLEPEGLCKGDICVPTAIAPAAEVDLTEIAPVLGMGLAHDEETGWWALGPETLGGRALATATAPDLTLPDLDGTPFELASLRGSKVLLYAWSPY